MIEHGRQKARSLENIRDDHVERYRWAVQKADEYGLASAADLGGGFGYGTWILADTGLLTTFYDHDDRVLSFATDAWHHPNIASRRIQDFRLNNPDTAELFVAFEVLEHFHSSEFLKEARQLCKIFVGSVPNEGVVPFKGASVHPGHVRHYTPDQLASELIRAGFKNFTIGSQKDKRGSEAKVDESSIAGRTLVFCAEGDLYGA